MWDSQARRAPGPRVQQEGRLSEAPKRFAVLRVAATSEVVRPRLVARFAAAALERVVVVAASAGYGKSTALRQYLEASSEPFVRFDVRAEHGTLLGFARGFAGAFSDIYPHLPQNLLDAYNGARAVDAAGRELARWAADELRAFDGIVAIDDLHLAQNDPQTIAFLTTLIESRARARWILCTRSTANLPIGTWAVGGAMTLPIDERDLCFTVEEAHEAATLLDTITDAEAVGDLVELTRGWPAALAFALRSSAHAGDARRLAAATRDVMYRYLSEQVYDSIAQDERKLLQHIAYLPEIDFEVLSAAGFANARKTLDELRRRVTFIGVENPERYKCHDLFVEFLRHRVETDGTDAARAIQLNVANALEQQDRIADAVRAYAAARSERDVLRLLVAHGLNLNDTGYSDVIRLAIAALSPETQASSAIVIALRGLHESQMGRFDKAEDLLRRALTKAPEPSRAAAIGIRLGLVLTNVGRDAREFLSSLEMSVNDAKIRAELAAILAVAHARFGDTASSGAAMARARACLRDIEDSTVCSKVYFRLGAAAIDLNMPYADVIAHATEALRYAEKAGSDIAIASACAVLANAETLYKEDLDAQLKYVQMLRKAAPQDRLMRRTAVIFDTMRACWTGDEILTASTLREIDTYVTSDALRSSLGKTLPAMWHAWKGDFAMARSTLDGALGAVGAQFPWNVAFWSGVYAVLCVADEAYAEAKASIERACASSMSPPNMLAERLVQRGRVLCAVAEALMGRITAAERLLRTIEAADPRSVALRQVGVALCTHLRNGDDMLGIHLEELEDVDFGGMRKLLRMVFERSDVLSAVAKHVPLTKAEIAVLKALSLGQSPKEIAAETGRSVHTIRTLSQHAAEKLGTSGRQQTIAAARRAGLISD